MQPTVPAAGLPETPLIGEWIDSRRDSWASEVVIVIILAAIVVTLVKIWRR